MPWRMRACEDVNLWSPASPVYVMLVNCYSVVLARCWFVLVSGQLSVVLGHACMGVVQVLVPTQKLLEVCSSCRMIAGTKECKCCVAGLLPQMMARSQTRSVCLMPAKCACVPVLLLVVSMLFYG
jgi:hypothetical protein